MTETRYFAINHDDAFGACFLRGVKLCGGALVTDGERCLIITPVMDCGNQGNRWQRLLADMELPDGARVTWRFFTTDLAYAAQEMDELTKSPDMDDKLEKFNRFEAFSPKNANDFLLTGVQGRYLSAAAEISIPLGSPPAVIRSIRIFCEWESFLSYLPEIFRDEGGFLDRFLKLFAAPYLDLEKKIDTLPEAFNPCVAPPDTLRWLAEVIGIPHIGLWETENLRKLLVTGTYRKKGRLSAIPELIWQFTGFRPYVAENFRMLTGEDENDSHYRVNDLCLFMPPEAARANLNMDALNLVIKSFLPDGVTYRVEILDDYPVLSGYAYLGINTGLGCYRNAELGVNSRLNYVILKG